MGNDEKPVTGIEEILNALKKQIDASATNLYKFLKGEQSTLNDVLFEEAEEVVIEPQPNLNDYGDKKGIYAFRMTDDFEANQAFNKVKYAAKRKGKKNVFKKDEFLYLGKALDFGERLKNHLKGLPRKTYSLKLNSAKRKGLKEKVKVYFFELKSDFNDSVNEELFFHILLSSTEYELHEKLKPLVGSSKVY